MNGEIDLDFEEDTPKRNKPITKVITLQKAVDMGEYEPEYLANFAMWHSLTHMMRWYYIREAIKNRKRFLLMQWAEINNTLDFRIKPELKDALKNIEKDEEWLQIAFAKGVDK